MQEWKVKAHKHITFNSAGAAPSSSSGSNTSEADIHSKTTQAHRKLLLTALSIDGSSSLFSLLSPYPTVTEEEDSSRNSDVLVEPFELQWPLNYHKLPAHMRTSLPSFLTTATVNRHLAIFLFMSPLAILLDQDLAEPKVKTKDIFPTTHALSTARPARTDAAEK
ncbi:hypothetical protein C8J57DRAFT_1231257 [Mycena rebaudengoi]|nr:hypothetical protein C8J57DRAFT_1231257 [Mycena rebaudengoi]